MTENPKTSTETTSNIKPLPKKPPALTVQPTEEQGKVTKACSDYITELKRVVIAESDKTGRIPLPRPLNMVDCPSGYKVPIKGVDY